MQYSGLNEAVNFIQKRKCSWTILHKNLMKSNAPFVPERINVASSVPKPASKFVGLENRSTHNCRLKNGGLKRQEKNNPSHPPASDMYLHNWISGVPRTS